MSVLLVSFIAVSSVQSQTKQIEKLTLKKKKIESQIGVLKDSLESVEQKINALKSKEMIKKASDSSIYASTKSYSYLKEKPEVMGKIIKKFGQLNDVLILDYIDGYFGVCVKDECGYMSELYIIKNDKIKAFVEAKKDEAFELQMLKEERELKAKKEELARQEKEYIKTYGKATFKKLKEGYIWLGMTKKMAIISRGYPEDINRSVGSWGVKEQWVYGNGTYLYFDNGSLSSWQN